MAGLEDLQFTSSSVQELEAERILEEAIQRIRNLALPLMEELADVFPDVDMDTSSLLERTAVNPVKGILIAKGRHLEETIILKTDDLYSYREVRKVSTRRRTPYPNSYPVEATGRTYKGIWLSHGKTALTGLRLLKEGVDLPKLWRTQVNQ
jgi:hypothetical protein